MSDMFYRSFEDRHRGSIELIKSRLSVYLPFIQPLKKIYPSPKALDLGCGRGEWLELLQEHQFEVLGIDTDEGMLENCKKRNLSAIQDDALNFLKKQASESYEIISAFHVIEHIPFDTLRTLVDEAHRVLKPGGLLILETPNSENLLVGTSSFYLDPTHQRPIPELLLSFVVEHAQFSRIRALYLQEPKQDIKQYTIRTLLKNVSPDYAVVAQKSSISKMAKLFDSAFNQSYGNRLLELTDKYDIQLETKFKTITNQLNELCLKTRVIEDKANETNTAELVSIESRLKEIETFISSLSSIHKNPHANTNNLELFNLYLKSEIQKLYTSRSWRYTYILRQIADKYRKLIKPILIYLVSKTRLTRLVNKSLPSVYPKPISRNSDVIPNNELSTNGNRIYLKLLKSFKK